MRLLCAHYRTGEPVAVEIEEAGGGWRARRVAGRPTDPAEYILAPVLVDIQVNGHSGVYFAVTESISEEGVAKVTADISHFGVGFYLPTVITGSFETIHHCLTVIARSRRQGDLARRVPAIHLEGPYISAEDGPRGAHPKEHARPPSWDEFARWQEAAEGLIRYVTLAPELPGAVDFIKRLRREGILPAIGHTAASPDDIRAAVDAGAVLSTHLGNGSHALIRRHPNYIWEQLATDELWASLIPDGHHLPPSVLKVMIRAKGIERTVLTTDASALAGMPPGLYEFSNRKVEVVPGGPVRLVGTEYLAGSALEMNEAVANTVRFAGVSLAAAFEMASLHPAYLLRTYGNTDIRPFDDGTFGVYRWRDERLEVVATVVDGDVKGGSVVRP